MRQCSIRTTGKSYAGGGSGTVQGTTLALQSIVEVRWGWLALLASQVALTAVVVAAMVRMTVSSGVQVLKDSSLATMCFLDPETRAALGPVSDFRVVKEKAKSVKVVL